MDTEYDKIPLDKQILSCIMKVLARRADHSYGNDRLDKATG